ncbi:MAG: glycosyltransferase [Bacteroidota bacterium]
MFEIIFLIAVSIYFIQTVLFAIGASLAFPKLSDNELPNISVIVAARNEEENIQECLVSLDNLIYPKEKIQIIIVDDKSTDNTSQIVEEFIEGKEKFIKVVTSKDIGHLKGKTLAIANGIEQATGEIIMTTDADCEVSPNWARTIASYYTSDDIAIVNGMTNQHEYNGFAAMQSMDFIYLLSVASGSINLGKPLSCIGNNMSYRKSVYDEIGGYSALKFSVTEDFNLLMATHKLKKYKILYPVDPNALVTSKPCSTLKSLFHQKKRWSVGGLESDFAGYAVMTVGFLTHLGVILTPFFFSSTVLMLSAFKIFTDYFFLSPVYKKLNLKLKLKDFVLFEIYFILYVFTIPFVLVFNRKVVWKGRNY